MTSSHSVPAATRRDARPASIDTPRMREVLSRIVSVEVAERAGVVAGALRARRAGRAGGRSSTIATTSSALSGNATSAGRWSTARFQAGGPRPSRVERADDEVVRSVRRQRGRREAGLSMERDPRRGGARRASGESLSSRAVPDRRRHRLRARHAARRRRRACSRSAPATASWRPRWRAGYDVVAIDPASERAERATGGAARAATSAPFDAARGRRLAPPRRAARGVVHAARRARAARRACS